MAPTLLSEPTMLFVKTKLGPSAIHGLGIIADQLIEKGALIWRFTPGLDLRYTDEQIARLPSFARDYLHLYSFPSLIPGHRTLCADNGRYFNHSNTPSALSAREEGEEEVVTRALRDIAPGEEISDDYGSFTPGFQGW